MGLPDQPVHHGLAEASCKRPLGRRLALSPSLKELRERVASELARLPDHFRRLENTPPVPVLVAQPLRDLAKAVDAFQP